MKDFFGDLFEDLGKRIGETAEVVASKAGEAIEIERLKGQIRDFSRENAVDLMEIGKMVYDSFKNGEEVGEDAEALCEAIKERKESIAEYEKKISLIKGSTECSGCGKMVAHGMSFCPYCGEKVETEAPEEEEVCFEDEASEKPCCSEEDVADEACCCEESSDDEACCCEEKSVEEPCCCEGETVDEACCEEEKPEE